MKGKQIQCFCSPLFHLPRSIWWFFKSFFLRLQKHCWDEKLPPPSVFLSAAWDFSSYCKLQEMREEKIPPLGEHPVHLAPAAGPSWTLHHMSHLYTGHKCLFNCLFLSPHEDSSPSPLLLCSHTLLLLLLIRLSWENSLVYKTCFEVVQITVM